VQVIRRLLTAKVFDKTLWYLGNFCPIKGMVMDEISYLYASDLLTFTPVKARNGVHYRAYWRKKLFVDLIASNGRRPVLSSAFRPDKSFGVSNVHLNIKYQDRLNVIGKELCAKNPKGKKTGKNDLKKFGNESRKNESNETTSPSVVALFLRLAISDFRPVFTLAFQDFGCRIPLRPVRKSLPKEDIQATVLAFNPRP
jgi:hypothetical protein